jgi:hypothetical protein
MADKQPPRSIAPASDQPSANAAKAAATARKQARLADALKANMARRKGQARARAVDGTQAETTHTAQTAQQKDP